VVLSIAEKAHKMRQVSVEKASESEPLLKCRKCIDDIKTDCERVSREEFGSNLLTVQAVSGMKVARAQHRRLCGTGEPVGLMTRKKNKSQKRQV